jgi:exodeoxyribonuclease VII small subunit
MDLNDRLELTQPEAPQSFEDSLRRLQRIIEALEEGDLPIDDAVTLYEEGMRLVGVCNQRLDTVDLRITQLSQNADGTFGRVPFVTG